EQAVIDALEVLRRRRPGVEEQVLDDRRSALAAGGLPQFDAMRGIGAAEIDDVVDGRQRGLQVAAEAVEPGDIERRGAARRTVADDQRAAAAVRAEEQRTAVE